MKNILVTAYDIDPYKGSESATGWNLVVQIARYNKTIAITRKNNRKNIEDYFKANKIENLEFFYFDLPYFLRFWKKGSRGSSLYFYLWQFCMPVFIFSNKIKFDIAHNLNFHTDSFPSFLWVFGKPFVWGPINHHEKIPLKYLYKCHSMKIILKDRLTWFIKNIFWRLDPFLWITKGAASKIFIGNSSVQRRLKINGTKVKTLSQIASEDILIDTNDFLERNRIFKILFVGRLVPLKGADIVIKAFSKFINYPHINNAQLQIIGKGPEKENLVSLTKKLNIEKNVQFVEWMPKTKISKYYNEASIFFFPSHEGAGMVIAEAISYGLPVLCFDNVGPGELVNDSCALRVPYSTYNDSVDEFAEGLNCLYSDSFMYKDKSVNARRLFFEKYTWDSKGDFLMKEYQEL